jgi:hypothetical protein
LINTDNALQIPSGTQSLLARGTAPTGNTAHYLVESIITKRRRQAEVSSLPSMTDSRRLAKLRANMEFAELESRIAVAQENAVGSKEYRTPGP